MRETSHVGQQVDENLLDWMALPMTVGGCGKRDVRRGSLRGRCRRTRWPKGIGGHALVLSVDHTQIGIM
jgi:hypothetical protein